MYDIRYIKPFPNIMLDSVANNDINNVDKNMYIVAPFFRVVVISPLLVDTTNIA